MGPYQGSKGVEKKIETVRVQNELREFLWVHPQFVAKY